MNFFRTKDSCLSLSSDDDITQVLNNKFQWDFVIMLMNGHFKELDIIKKKKKKRDACVLRLTHLKQFYAILK